MNFSGIVVQTCKHPLIQHSEIGLVRLDIGFDLIRHQTYGGNVTMSVMQNEGAYAPLEIGWEPGQIYEVCTFEREYKEYIIRQLRHTYPAHLYISDCGFQDLESVKRHLNSQNPQTKVIILDISEVLYLDFIKDAEGLLQGVLPTFYESLERLSKTGITCIIFINALCYHQILQNTTRSDLIRICIRPAQERGFDFRYNDWPFLL